MPKSNTEKKVNEAKYFLRLLEEHSPKKTSKQEEFNYLLNAFVCSARSITWVMKAEFNSIKGWKTWYNLRKADQKEEKILKLFNKMRIETTKKKPLTTIYAVTFKIPFGNYTDADIKKLKSYVKNKQKVDMILGKNNSSEEPNKLKFKNVKVSNITYPIEGHSNADAFYLCKKYYKLLDKLASECLEKFGKYIT